MGSGGVEWGWGGESGEDTLDQEEIWKCWAVERGRRQGQLWSAWRSTPQTVLLLG